ncbi:hypothetical protein BW686_25075 [Pseudomonas syringae]|uniref:Uncharacterized protein n=1 Tax=Pseudomonas syringae TaxID=317 RepID=A0A244EJS4_PSESX|nr:hypothetical protein BW686_25075 [Pseudomonas syringae]
MICSGFVRQLAASGHCIQNLLRNRVPPCRRDQRAGRAGGRVFIYKFTADQAYAWHTLGIIHVVFLS